MQMFSSSSTKIDFESVADHQDLNVREDCAISKPGTHHERFAFCFDKKSGVLLERAFPELRSGSVFEHSCLYGTFKKFDDFWFPREIACFEDKHQTIEAKVVELTGEASLDPALFTAPPGAIELGMCSETVSPPHRSVYSGA